MIFIQCYYKIYNCQPIAFCLVRKPKKMFPTETCSKKLIISLDKLITDKLIIAKAVAQKTESGKNKNRSREK